MTLSFSFPTTCPRKVALVKPNAGLSPTLLATIRDLHCLTANQEVPKVLMQATTTLVHARVQECFTHVAPLLEAALRSQDTNSAWRCWSQAGTKGFASAISILGNVRQGGNCTTPVFDHVGHPQFTTRRQFKA